MKKIAFLGDSITQGACVESDEIFHALVAKKLGVQALNFGIGGTRIAKQTKEISLDYSENFVDRAKRMDKDVDFVFVFGGTNDFGHGDAEIGEFGDDTEYTFYGAVKKLVEYLVGEYGREKICFILPLHRTNENNTNGDGAPNKTKHTGTLGDYIKALVRVLDSFGINYLDLSDEFPPEKLPELTADGLHPNAEGHKIIADAAVGYIRSL